MAISNGRPRIFGVTIAWNVSRQSGDHAFPQSPETVRPDYRLRTLDHSNPLLLNSRLRFVVFVLDLQNRLDEIHRRCDRLLYSK